jgi:[ribosomal protein S5]-alanine N-acetyltransferase
VNPVSVRDAAAADAEAIARVARASWSETYGDLFDAAFIAEFLDANYRPAALAEQAKRAADAPDRHFLVAERDGDVVAFAEFGQGTRGPELFRIYADPAHFGTGTGTALLDELHRRLLGNVDAYVAEVHAQNERGRAFYDRNGFVIVGEGTLIPGSDILLRRTLTPMRPRLPVETDRLRLRELTEGDTEALHRIYGDAETTRFLGRTGRPTADLEGTGRVVSFVRRHAELHGFSMWAVDEREGEPVVGIAGLIWVEGHGPDVEAAFVIRRDRWGRGYATEALRAALRIGHDELGLSRIVALAYPANEPSRRVMEKAGMRADGTVDAYGHELTRHVSERAASSRP